jgi:sRNA-binding regulator protein Hfq
LKVGESKVNRKLIRTTLAEVKGREVPHHKDRHDRPGQDRRSSPPPSRDNAAAAAAAQGRKRIPPSETNAEIFYYKKQMDAHTVMCIVLRDGEEIEGTIEWYDRSALKVNRKDAPNILLLKHNIKYMFKAEDRNGGGGEEAGS